MDRCELEKLGIEKETPSGKNLKGGNMKTQYAIKTLSRYAKVNKANDRPAYWAMRDDKEGRPVVISFIDQDGKAICIHTRSASELNQSEIDYFPGSFWDSIAEALRYGWNIETRRQK